MARKRRKNLFESDKNAHWSVQFIYREMLAKNLSVYDIAEFLHMPTITIYQWGKCYKADHPRMPKISDVEKILKFLGYKFVIVKDDKHSDELTSMSVSELLADRDRYKEMCKKLIEQKRGRK